MSASWVVWPSWVLACIVGWIAGGVIFGTVYSAVGGSAYETVGGIVGLSAIGVVIGGLQWLVLRRQICRAGPWIWVSAAGILVGIVVSQWLDLVDIYIAPGVELDELLAGAGFGTAAGIAQWMVLRQRVQGAGWWIAANIIGGAVSFFGGGLVAALVKVTIPEFPTVLVTGTLYGTVTGSALVALLRKPVLDGSNLTRSAPP